MAQIHLTEAQMSALDGTEYDGMSMIVFPDQDVDQFLMNLRRIENKIESALPATSFAAAGPVPALVALTDLAKAAYQATGTSTLKRRVRTV